MKIVNDSDWWLAMRNWLPRMNEARRKGYVYIAKKKKAMNDSRERTVARECGYLMIWHKKEIWHVVEWALNDRWEAERKGYVFIYGKKVNR